MNTITIKIKISTPFIGAGRALAGKAADAVERIEDIDAAWRLRRLAEDAKEAVSEVSYEVATSDLGRLIEDVDREMTRSMIWLTEAAWLRQAGNSETASMNLGIRIADARIERMEKYGPVFGFRASILKKAEAGWRGATPSTMMLIHRGPEWLPALIDGDLSRDGTRIFGRRDVA